MPDMTVDEFMARIAGIESGGASDPANVRNPSSGAHGIFQIMPSNWSPWAQEAGLGANAPRTAANQRRVARHKMEQYRRQYGSWDAAAVAWFAGPDRARRFNEGDRSVLSMSDGNMTVAEYVERVRRADQQRQAGQAGPAGSLTSMPPGPDLSDLGGLEGLLAPDEDRSARVSALWTHMIQSVSNQIRSGQGEEVAPAWVEPQPDNPVAPGADGDPTQPGDLGLTSDGVTHVSGTGEAAEFIDAARQFVGTPYVWGGADPSGFDCSGLIQYAARQIGVTLPRVSRDQARAGQEVPLGQAQPGDLIAFPARGQEVGHIGILVGRDEQGRWLMLHAPRSGQNVRIEPIGRRQVATVRRVFGQGTATQQPTGGRSANPSTTERRPTRTPIRPQQTPRGPVGGQRATGGTHIPI